MLIFLDVKFLCRDLESEIDIYIQVNNRHIERDEIILSNS